ncbi:MAG: tetratricopeptide repeat protein [Crocinitomicaceae bacterium]|nr:tetratricopeptide repeat protein [Crocinitomicaceae bacterium]
MYRVLLILLLLPHANGWGQASVKDSLLIELSNATSQKRSGELCIELSFNVRERDSSLWYLEKAKSFITESDWKLQLDLEDAFSIIYFETENYNLAENHKRKAVELIEKFGDKEECAQSYLQLVEYQKKALLYGEALITSSKARKLFAELKDINSELKCLSNMGKVHKRMESYNAALSIYHEVYELAKECSLDEHVASACINIGIVLKNRGSYKDALEYCFEAEEIHLNNKNFKGLADVYNNIGNIERLQGDFQRALLFYSQSIENREKTSNLTRLGYTYNNIGLTYLDMENSILAIDYLKKAEGIKLACKDFETIASTYLNLSEVYLNEGDDIRYTLYSKKASEFAVKYLNDIVLREVTINNAEFAARHGDHQRAYLYLSSVFNELDTLDDRSSRIAQEVLQAHFRDEQKEIRINKLGEVNYLLASRQEELEKNQEISFMLILALTILLIAFSVLLFLLNRKQQAYRNKSKELEITNQQLVATTVSIEEKETLLKEIHHRVKNNLQIMKSLVRLQQAEVESNHERELLLDFEQRVSSMALVHESLYKSGELARIDVKDYYQKLIDELVSAYKLEQIISTNVIIDIDDLGVDTLLPLGMLTNEIISNSLKHAFDKEVEGVLSVELTKIDEDCYRLFIGDNGKGFNFEVAGSKVGSLGIELIQTLVDQLDGTFSYNNDNGSYYCIEFKSQEKE